MIIDASNVILGRLCSYAAKQAMLGQKIDIINCEKAVISGARLEIIARYKHTRFGRTTPMHGPFISRMPDRFVRRAIRGMLPHKKSKGEDAFKRVMCHIGVPKEFEGKHAESLKTSQVEHKQITRYMHVLELCKELGAKL